MHRFLEASAGDYMTRAVQTVDRDTTMRELQQMFEETGFNAFPVRDNNDIVGFVTRFDFLKCFVFTTSRMVPSYDELLLKTVDQVMTPEFIYVEPATRLPRVLHLIVEHRMKSLPVLDAEQRLAGIIARADIMHALAGVARAGTR
jgi:CBS-domain-containing membrane protein